MPWPVISSHCFVVTGHNWPVAASSVSSVRRRRDDPLLLRPARVAAASICSFRPLRHPDSGSPAHPRFTKRAANKSEVLGSFTAVRRSESETGRCVGGQGVEREREHPDRGARRSQRVQAQVALTGPDLLISSETMRHSGHQRTTKRWRLDRTGHVTGLVCRAPHPPRRPRRSRAAIR